MDNTARLPREDSQAANDAIHAMLLEYNTPANPQNAGRAGWRAARLYLEANSLWQEQPQTYPIEIMGNYVGEGRVTSVHSGIPQSSSRTLMEMTDVCKMCNGESVIPDGICTHSGDGFEYDKPVKQVRDCPTYSAKPDEISNPKNTNEALFKMTIGEVPIEVLSLIQELPKLASYWVNKVSMFEIGMDQSRDKMDAARKEFHSCVEKIRIAISGVSLPLPTEQLRKAAERTRADLGPTGTNYPDVRTLLEFAERAIQSQPITKD